MGGARAFNRYAVADSLDRVLAESETPGDSAVILSDMFDVVARQHRDSIGTMAFHSAVRAGDSRLALDLLRNLANTHLRNDSLLQVDFDRAMRFESSDDRSATVAFIRMLHNSYKVRYATPQEQDKQIIKLLKELNVNPEGDCEAACLMSLYRRMFPGRASFGIYLAIGRFGESVAGFRICH